MAYIGKEPANSFISFAKQDFTTSATTSYTLDHSVVNENELALFINFVRQEPTTAYTASGTSLTLTSATSASDDMYCVFLGKAVQTVNPPNGSVTNSMLASGSFSNITDVGTLSSGLTLSDNILFDTASKGIYLGVTSATASNLLDDYEEGTFTPTLGGTTSSGALEGWYRKVGSLVTVTAILSNKTLSSSSGTAKISNLPFSVNSSSSKRSAGLLGYNNTTASSSNSGSFIENTADFYLYNSGTISTATFSDGGGKYLLLTGNYITD